MFTRMISMALTLALALVLAFSLAGCSTAPATPGQANKLNALSSSTIDRFKVTDPSLAPILDKAVAYAVFPAVDEGAAGIGGGGGRGELYEHGKWLGYQLTGYCKVARVTLGAQLGGQEYMELIVFTDKAALERFKANQLAFDAQASAVAAKAGAAAAADYGAGAAVFTQTVSGLMFEASIGGQKFTYVSKDAAQAEARQAAAE
jgi:lipid-binding SYLF domain-containing protein